MWGQTGLTPSPRFPPGFWAVTWEPRGYVLTQVSVKNRREPGAPGMIGQCYSNAVLRKLTSCQPSM